MKYNKAEIEKAIADGYVNKNTHPDGELFNLNYSNKCQTEWNWDGAQRYCRGLIVDKDYNLVARSYDKFFTLDQIEDSGCDILPPKNSRYEVSKKTDGFLGVMYFYQGRPEIGSRGSFTSEMADIATDMLYTQYFELLHTWDSNYSYVFEIIYPNDLLTIAYKETELRLHGVFNNETGEELSITEAPNFKELSEANFPMELPVETGENWYGIEEFYKRYKFNDDEGYVVTFPDSNWYRIKVKFDEYKVLSRAKTSIGAPGSKAFINNLISGATEEVLDKNPNLKTAERMASINAWYNIYDSIFVQAKNEFERLEAKHDNIPDFMKEASSLEVGSVIIKMKTNINKIESGIWNYILKRREMFTGDNDE
jgi:hypothetical protein